MTSLVLGDDYNFGPESCYAIAKAITCRGDDAEKALKANVKLTGSRLELNFG